MALSSEQVHWLLGGLVTLVAAALLLRATGLVEAGWLRFILPAALLLLGAETFLDPLIHGGKSPHGPAEKA